VGQIYLDLVSYTNNVGGNPVVLIEMHNTGSADALPIVGVADLGSGTNTVANALADEALPSGSRRTIELAYSPKLSSHKFYVGFSQSPFKYRCFQWARRLHVSKVVPQDWSETGTAVIESDSPSK
jgi:hypothetical protein